MMLIFMVIFLLLAFHWLGDFVFQSHRMSMGKSKSSLILLQHVGVYTGTLAVLMISMSGISMPVIYFLAVNGAAHFVTDFFTSRWTSRLYARGDWHNFFVVIGLDQLIHQTTLLVTLVWLIWMI